MSARPRSWHPRCPLRGSLQGLRRDSASAGTHTSTDGSPPRKSARSPSSPPSAPPDPAPSGSPAAAASHQPSGCTAAAPAAGDICLPAGRLEARRASARRRAPRPRPASPDPPRPRRGCCAPASTPPTGRHSCRSGHTAHGNAASCSAWHAPIACVGVVALCRRPDYAVPGVVGRRPGHALALTPATSTIKAGSLPSSALSCTPSSVLRTPRTPSGSARFHHRLIRRSLPD